MADTSRSNRPEASRGRSRSMSPQQWGALIGGGALAIYGLTRRSRLGVALAAGGGTLALVGANRKPSESNVSPWTALLVSVKREEAYRFWRDFQNLPNFMNRLQSVTVQDDRRSSWAAYGPGGRLIEWETEITDERENEYIAWRSLPGSDIRVDGRVEFTEAPAGRGTFIRARLEFGSPVGVSGGIGKLLSKGANFAIRQDLRRLEALMEAGEIPTIEGQSHGPRDAVTGVMRMADPTRPIPAGSKLSDVFAERRRSA